MVKDHKSESFEPANFDRSQLAAFRDHHHPTYTRFPKQFNGSMFAAHRMNHDEPLSGGDMNSKSITRVEFWLGTITTVVGFLVIAIGATWTISNSINEKINSSRQELAGNIQVSKTEITTRLDRVEDKMDSNFKEMSASLIKIQSTLDAEKEKSNKG